MSMPSEGLCLVDGSLREHDDLVGRFHLELQTVSGGIVLTEGPTDRAALQLIVPPSRIFVVGPKPQLLDTCRGLEKLGDHRFVAVFDRDFDPMPVGTTFAIHVYENGDLEAAVLAMGIGLSLLETIVPSLKLAAAGGADQVLDEAIVAIFPVSRLRAANREQQWGLPFDEVDIGRYVGANRSLEVGNFVRALRAACFAHRHTGVPEEADLLCAAEADCDVKHFRGRDLLCVLERYLRSTALRHRRGVDPSRESLGVMVQVAAPGVLATSDWGLELQVLINSAA
jgi:hypothetical protein